jgi:voltage-gated potassium channel
LIILARGEFPSTEKKLRQAGADHVVSPAEIGALRMSHIITHPAALNLLEETKEGSNLNELLAQLEMTVDELVVTEGTPLVGQSIGMLQSQGHGHFLVVALRRLDGTTTIHPGPEVQVWQGDTVIIMGHRGEIPKFAAHFALKRQMQFRGARHRR